MLDPKKIEEAVQAITKVLPAGITNMQEDVEKNVRAALSATFAKLELVTREEFDIQSQVLQKTRAKLEELELRVKEIETQK
jgi:hypothetical protein